MNIPAIAFLALFASSPLEPLYIVDWRANMLAGPDNVSIPVSPDMSVIPIPPELTKQGWLCTFSKRSTNKQQRVQVQSVVCHFGDKATFAATAVCRLNGPDVDIQRVTIGNADTPELGITLGCRTTQAVGAGL